MTKRLWTRASAVKEHVRMPLSNMQHHHHVSTHTRSNSSYAYLCNICAGGAQWGCTLKQPLALQRRLVLQELAMLTAMEATGTLHTASVYRKRMCNSKCNTVVWVIFALKIFSRVALCTKIKHAEFSFFTATAYLSWKLLGFLSQTRTSPTTAYQISL